MGERDGTFSDIGTPGAAPETVYTDGQTSDMAAGVINDVRFYPGLYIAGLFSNGLIRCKNISTGIVHLEIRAISGFTRIFVDPAVFVDRLGPVSQ